MSNAATSTAATRHWPTTSVLTRSHTRSPTEQVALTPGLVTVEVKNSLPILTADELVTGKGLPASIDVLANDVDPNQHPLSITDFMQAAHGSVDCAAAGVCTYTPEDAFIGTDSFQYMVSDGHDGLATTTVSVTVREIVDGGPDWFWREERELAFDPTITSPAEFACTWSFGDGSPDSA